MKQNILIDFQAWKSLGKAAWETSSACSISWHPCIMQVGGTEQSREISSTNSTLVFNFEVHQFNSLPLCF